MAKTLYISIKLTISSYINHYFKLDEQEFRLEYHSDIKKRRND